MGNALLTARPNILNPIRADPNAQTKSNIMEKLTLKDLAIDHDYYASDSNYYSNDAGFKYDNWADFYNEFKEADVDMNLVYRWDIIKRDNVERYYAQVTMIGQRKGKYIPIQIGYIDEKDLETFIPFMQKHWQKLQSIWMPLSLTTPTKQ